MQPLSAAYAKTCLPVIEHMIQAENYRLRQLLTPEHTVISDILVPQEHFYNMNDMPSYYHALQMLAEKQPALFPPDFISQTDQPIPYVSFSQNQVQENNLSGKTGCLPEGKGTSHCPDQT